MWDIFRPSKDIRGYLDNTLSKDYLTLLGKVMTIVAIYENRLKLVSAFLTKSNELVKGFDGVKHSKESISDIKDFMNSLTTYKHIGKITQRWSSFFEILDNGRKARNEIVHDHILNFYPLGVNDFKNDDVMQSILIDIYPKIEKISHAISALDFLANITATEIIHGNLSKSLLTEISNKCSKEKYLLRDWFASIENIDIKVFPLLYKYILERS